MFTNTRFFLCFIFLIICSSSMAQDQIERLFRSDRVNTGIDVGQTSDEGYLILSAGRSLDSTRFEYYTVTKFDNKGNLSWSRDYDFEQKVFPDGSLTVLENDNFILSGVLDTTALNKVLMKGDPNGEIAWTRGFGREDTETPSFPGNAATDTTYNDGFYIAGDGYNSALNSDIYLGRSDKDGLQLWAKSFGDGASFSSAAIATTQDSGAIICGTTFSPPIGLSRIFAVKTDSLGNIEWSRTYGQDNRVNIGTAVVATPDGGYMIGGRKNNPSMIPPSHPGSLIKVDTFGVTQWNANIDFGTSDTVMINNLIVAGDGNVVVSGSLLGLSIENTFAFMAKIDLNGDVIWKRRYKVTTRQFPYANGLMESPIGGFVALTSSDEVGQPQVGPYLIKTEDDGTTICDSIIDSQLLFPETLFTVDTLMLTSADITDSRDITLLDTLNYGGFQPVTVTLESFGPYCPGEIFSDTLDATTDGAIAYEWSTGETTPMIVVTEPDEYMVTVTIGVDYCYLLCASTSIGERPLPMVELDFNDGTFCTSGTVSVLANGSDIDSYQWSTNETSSIIVVDQEATYSVTVTNACGTSEDGINITFDTSAPEVMIDNDGNFCSDGMEQLSVSTSSSVDGFLWTTGEETSSINIDELGTYSVTALSNFCDDGMATYVVNDVDPTVSISGGEAYCLESSDVLTASSITATSYLWSTGETTPFININSEGTYMVTVTDFCGQANSETTITCPIVYDIANIFTPGEAENNLLIPIFRFDPSSLVEYEFTVFSRWGEKVFETTNPAEGWDGMVNDKEGAADVYFFIVKGMNSLGVSMTREKEKPSHGDVTLLR